MIFPMIGVWRKPSPVRTAPAPADIVAVGPGLRKQVLRVDFKSRRSILVRMPDSSIKPASSEPMIRVVMMPRDANANQTIFGGIILSYIDQAGFVECCRQAQHRYVTVAMDKVEFHEPVFIGDIVSFYARTLKIGRTSITVKVTVRAHHRQSHDQGTGTVTEAQLVYVAIDEAGRSLPIFPDSGAN